MSFRDLIYYPKTGVFEAPEGLPNWTQIDLTRPPQEVGFYFGRYRCFEGAVRDTWTAHNEENNEQQ